MNTTELQCCVDCDQLLKTRVYGVFAADRLPTKLLTLPVGFIANTDIHSKEGRHWCAFFVDNNGQVEFFDSYGRSPEYNSSFFKKWLNDNALTVKYNDVQIQSDYSNVCGLYCLFYLRQRLCGLTMNDIISYFDYSNFAINDSFIFNYMSRIYSDCMKNACVYNQTCKPLIKR